MSPNYQAYFSGNIVVLRPLAEERMTNGTLAPRPRVFAILYDEENDMFTHERVTWALARQVSATAMDDIAARMEADRQAEIDARFAAIRELK